VRPLADDEADAEHPVQLLLRVAEITTSVSDSEVPAWVA